MILLFIIITFCIYKKAYPNNKLTCNNYILNTYLYIIISIVIVSIIVLYIDNTKLLSSKLFGQNINTIYFILMFVFTIGILLMTMFIDPRKTLLKHLSWLIFVCLIGITMYPIYLFTKMNNTFLSTLMTTLIIVILITVFAFYKPELISLSLGPVLITLLLIGIIMSVFNMLLNKNQKSQKKIVYILSYGFVVVFCFLLLYDTKKLQVNAKKCVTPDYINESIGIFLDIINLFSNLGNIKG